MDYSETNTATTRDWLKSSEGVTLVTCGPVLALTGSFEGTEEVAPERAVQLPENVGKKLFSKTQPGLPAPGHEI